MSTGGEGWQDKNGGEEAASDGFHEAVKAMPLNAPSASGLSARESLGHLALSLMKDHNGSNVLAAPNPATLE